MDVDSHGLGGPIEREELNKLDDKLKAPNGAYLLGEFEQIVSKRAQAIRRSQLEKLGIAT